MKRTFRDGLWLWGQDAGAHHKPEYGWNIPGENRMGPVEAAAYLDISNCFRVVMGGSPEPPFDAESEKLAGFDQVVWSVLGDKSSVRNDGGADDLAEVLRQAEKYPNVTGGVLDDFFFTGNRRGKDHLIPVERDPGCVTFRAPAAGVVSGLLCGTFQNRLHTLSGFGRCGDLLVMGQCGTCLRRRKPE